MRHVLGRLAQAEMQHEERHGPALAVQRFRAALPAGGVAQKVAIVVHDVAVAGDHVRGQHAPVRQGHPGRARAVRVDPRDLGVQQHLPAKPLEQRDHARDQPVGAALGEPDPAAPLQRVDQRIDRAGREGIPAHQQRVIGERLPQIGVLDEGRDLGMDRLVGLQLHQRGRGLEHLAQLEEGHGAQLDVTLLIDLLRVIAEAAVSLQVVRVEPGDLALQLIGLVHIVEDLPARPHQPIEGRDRHQRHVARHVLPGQRPQLLERIGVGDDGGARVEDMALIVPDIGPPAGLVAGLDQGRGDARRLQADGQGQAAEACSDHDGRLGRGRMGVHAFSFSRGRSGRQRIAVPMGMGGLPVTMRN